MIQAIETRYAGCRFRSRLEARWAVFFDQLGIQWEYERQGYTFSRGRLTLDEMEVSYLPDFWFPDHGLHGEVKGALTHPELTRLLNAAASLSSNDGDGCWQPASGSHDLVVFGNIPGKDAERLPTRLHMHKGDLGASAWFPSKLSREYHHRSKLMDWVTDHACGAGRTIASDYGGDPGIYSWDLTPDQIASWLTKGSWADQALQLVGRPGWVSDWQSITDAYTAARSARFEHGESGA